MRIESSTIGMDSARSYKTSTMAVRRFMIMDYQQEVDQSNTLLNTTVSEEEQSANQTEDNAQTAENAENKENAANAYWENRLGINYRRTTIKSNSDYVVNDIRQLTVRYIFDLLFASRKSRFQQWLEENDYVQSSATEQMQDIKAANNQLGDVYLVQEPRVITASLKVLNFTEESWTTETEDTQFSTQGTVKTADGREIAFNVNVGMSREFTQYFRQDLQLAQFSMCDPLVINLDTDMASLTDQNFYFDIDADGEEDEIASLSSNSGYLALDKNGDGTINDGNELFGTKSGNGFADLAEYDEDGNGWIDENDAVWEKLQIWCKDENGKDVLYRLSEKNVGAICLQNTATDFALKNQDGRMLGNIRNTGFFLYENGMAGTLQHVDVAKYSKEA